MRTTKSWPLPPGFFVGLILFFVGVGPILPDGNHSLKYTVMAAGILVIVVSMIRFVIRRKRAQDRTGD